jgi:hypothetical protein
MVLPSHLQCARDDLDRALGKNDTKGTRADLQELLTHFSWGVDVSQLRLPKIVALGFADSNPYVRRMAVLATIHIQKVAPASTEAKGITNRLCELLRDRDPRIVCNSLLALLKNSGGAST